MKHINIIIYISSDSYQPPYIANNHTPVQQLTVHLNSYLETALVELHWEKPSEIQELNQKINWGNKSLY